MLFFFRPAPFVVHFFSTNDTLHSRQGYILNSKISFRFSLTFTRIGTFGRAGRRDILFFVVCCNSNRTSIKQCSHSNFFLFPSTDTSPDKQATLFLIQKSKTKSFPEGTTRKLHCFSEGSVQLHVPKSTWLPDGPFWTAEALQLWFLLNTANGLRPLSRASSVLGSMCEFKKTKNAWILVSVVVPVVFNCTLKV